MWRPETIEDHPCHAGQGDRNRGEHHHDQRAVEIGPPAARLKRSQQGGGEGLESGHHGASLIAGGTGVLHGALSSVLADEQGQILEAHSVSAGLDYPGVGPEHAYLRDSGRARYESATDAEALQAFRDLARLEGIIPALEPAHAISWLLRNGGDAAGFDVLTLSGRGDKDMDEVTAKLAHLDD